MTSEGTERLVDQLFTVGLVQQVLTGLLTALLIAATAFIFRNTAVKILKRLLPQIESKVPHINFEIKNTKDAAGKWTTNVTVSNGSNEPAYNLFMHYFEQFPDGHFQIRSSDYEDSITRPVLGIRGALEFKVKGVQFEGCGATCVQEIWIEYENALGVCFRVVSLPTAPRGDIPRILPPRVIKRRLEQLPGATLEGNEKLAKKIIRGKKTLLPQISKLAVAKYNLLTKPSWRLKDWYNRLKYERR